MKLTLEGGQLLGLCIFRKNFSTHFLKMSKCSMSQEIASVALSRGRRGGRRTPNTAKCLYIVFVCKIDSFDRPKWRGLIFFGKFSLDMSMSSLGVTEFVVGTKVWPGENHPWPDLGLLILLVFIYRTNCSVSWASFLTIKSDKIAIGRTLHRQTSKVEKNNYLTQCGTQDFQQISMFWIGFCI